MEVDQLTLCIGVVVALAPFHDNLCGTFETTDDLDRGDIKVLRVSTVVDEAYLDQLRLTSQVFPEGPVAFMAERRTESRR